MKGFRFLKRTIEINESAQPRKPIRKANDDEDEL